ncbi:MAG: DNA gyrase inhibitor YacG [Methylotenera sp.]
MSAIKSPKLVACPNCKKLSEYSASNPFRPFCSERCKLIDLGDWANENYKIPDNKPPEEPDEFNE